MLIHNTTLKMKKTKDPNSEPTKRTISKDNTVAVVGSRTFTNYISFTMEMQMFLQGEDIAMFVSGGAKGADKMAERYASQNKIEMRVLKPDWKTHGKKAGILRNMEIIDASSKVIAFWDGKSKGTKHSIDYAKMKDIPVKIVKF